MGRLSKEEGDREEKKKKDFIPIKNPVDAIHQVDGNQSVKELVSFRAGQLIVKRNDLQFLFFTRFVVVSCLLAPVGH